MIAIDIGNTKTLVGYVENKKIIKTWKMATHKNLLSDEYLVFINHFLSQVGTAFQKQDVCIASVVPHITAQLQTIETSHPIHFVTHQSPLSYAIDLPHPETMGADLVAAAQGALQKFKSPLIIVDAGTATTITVIDDNNKFRGGAICPGMGISSQALFTHAAALSPIGLKLPTHAIGNKTIDAVQSGSCLGHAAMIEKMIEKFEMELGYQTHVILTGGAIELLLQALPARYLYEPYLTLHGLISIFDNLKKAA